MFKHELIGDVTAPVNFTVAHVRINFGSVFSKVVQAYTNEERRVSRFTPNPDSNFDWNRYLKSLMWLHVNNVNGSVPHSYKFLVREVEVPALYETILAQVGVVVDKDFGIRFVPNIDVDAEDLMSPFEIMESSQFLLVLSELGIRTVKGLPNPKDSGSLGAMASSLVESGDILSYRKDHPVYGFIAACFEFDHLLQLMSGALRIKYGSISEFEAVAETIFAASVGAGDEQV